MARLILQLARRSWCRSGAAETLGGPICRRARRARPRRERPGWIGWGWRDHAERRAGWALARRQNTEPVERRA